MLKHIKNTEDYRNKNLAAKGFTLIELLVVIVILGVLAAVVVFAVSGITDRGEDAACDTDARTLRTAVESYRAQQGSYPTGSNNQQALVDAGFLSSTTSNHTYAVSGNQITVTAAGDCA